VFRQAVNLGKDAFIHSAISKNTIEECVRVLKSYRRILKEYQIENPSQVRVIATSAVREATNRLAFVDRIYIATGFQVEPLDEAEVIRITFLGVQPFLLSDPALAQSRTLVTEVGGGSTELTFFSNNKLVFKTSVNIGTIRLLQRQVTEAHWQLMKDTLKQQLKGYGPVTAIGSGGNINKIFSLSKRKEGKPLSLETLKDYYKEFSSFSVEERIHLYNLREDRADVIVPALQIYVNVMRWADATEIYVPKIGLADGLIQALYAEISGNLP